MSGHKTRLRILGTALFLVLLTSCLKQELQSGLTENEAQEIIVLLKEHGLEAVRSPMPKEKGGGQASSEGAWVVSVKGGDQNLVLAWRILQENGIPRQRVKGLSEVFATPGMIPTASEEKARMLVGLSGEIAKTLKSVPNVVDARVHIVIPENSPLLDRAQWSPTTASVLLKFQGSQPPLKADEVKLLVAKGVEGLQPDNVGVVYHRIEPKRDPPRDVGWYLGNQELLLIAVAVAMLTSFGSLILAWRGRQQRQQIEHLHRQLQVMVPVQERK